jgi:phospholipid N-methyltransferase
MKNNINYPGWELKYFDKALNFREYQFLLIKQYIGKVVAEVGPGNGVNLKIYQPLAKKIYLFEPSNIFIKKLNKYKNKKIQIVNSVFKKAKNKYDTIIYLDVLEHIKNDSKEIFNAYNSLKKNGYLIINVPAFQHLYSSFDKDLMHFKRYEKKDFKKIFNSLKIYSYKMIYFDSLGYFLSLLSKIFIKNYKTKFGSKILIWNKLIPLSIFLDRLFLNNFGKSLIVFVKKL